jgi:hypothetical protein
VQPIPPHAITPMRTTDRFEFFTTLGNPRAQASGSPMACHGEHNEICLEGVLY